MILQVVFSVLQAFVTALFPFTCDGCVKAFNDESISLGYELLKVSTTFRGPVTPKETLMKTMLSRPRYAFFLLLGMGYRFTFFEISLVLLVRF